MSVRPDTAERRGSTTIKVKIAAERLADLDEAAVALVTASGEWGNGISISPPEVAVLVDAYRERDALAAELSRLTERERDLADALGLAADVLNEIGAWFIAAQPEVGKEFEARIAAFLEQAAVLAARLDTPGAADEPADDAGDTALSLLREWDEYGLRQVEAMRRGLYERTRVFLAPVSVPADDAEWSFVYANGSRVQASREEVEIIAANATGRIETRSLWKPLAAPVSVSADDTAEGTTNG